MQKPILAVLGIDAGVLIPWCANGKFFDDKKIVRACPQAVAEKEQVLAELPSRREAAGITKPALREELLPMVEQDQAAHKRFEEALNAHAGDVAMDNPARLAAMRVDKSNLPRLKRIINQNGFPTTSMVGIDGEKAAFVFTQHSDDDPSFQAKILKVISPRLSSGEIDGNEFALLTDRVLLSQGKHQRYGTQFEGEADQLKSLPIEDEAHVDERRRAIGLVSMKNYACMLHALDTP